MPGICQKGRDGTAFPFVHHSQTGSERTVVFRTRLGSNFKTSDLFFVLACRFSNLPVQNPGGLIKLLDPQGDVPTYSSYFSPYPPKNSAFRADIPTMALPTRPKNLPYCKELNISPSPSVISFPYSNISPFAFPGRDPHPENLIFGASGGRLPGSGSLSAPQTVRLLHFVFIGQLCLLNGQFYLLIE